MIKLSKKTWGYAVHLSMISPAGLKLLGAWISWLASNGSHLIAGFGSSYSTKGIMNEKKGLPKTWVSLRGQSRD